MDSSQVFTLATNGFVLCWGGLFIAHFLPKTAKTRWVLLLLGGILAPAGLFLLFTLGVVNASDIEPAGSMTSFDGIVALFSVPERLLNVWVEILGFILLITHWIIEDSRRRDISRILVAPCLLLCFLSGAWGMLGYLLTVGVVTATRRFVSRREIVSLVNRA
jgi:hypothetical protein